MKKIVLILFILLSFPVLSAHSRDQWTREDTIYEGVFLVAFAADWMQTRWVAKHDYQTKNGNTVINFTETNPFITGKPSVGTIDAYFATAALVHVGVSYLLPKKWRRGWQIGGIFLEMYAIYDNDRQGAGMSFAF